MTAKTTILLTDSNLTPESPGTPAAVIRTFTPGAMENGFVHSYYEPTTGTTPDTKSKLTLGLTQAKDASPARVKAQLTLPKAQTIDGLVVRAHKNSAFLEYVFDKNSTRDDRRDARAMVYGLHADVGFQAMIDNLEDLY
jgi:hypothetical protein